MITGHKDGGHRRRIQKEAGLGPISHFAQSTFLDVTAGYKCRFRTEIKSDPNVAK